MVFANPPTNQKRLSWPENYLFLHSILLSEKEIQRRDTGRDLISLIILLQAEKWLQFGEIHASETTWRLPPPQAPPSHGHVTVTTPQRTDTPAQPVPWGSPQMAPTRHVGHAPRARDTQGRRVQWEPCWGRLATGTPLRLTISATGLLRTHNSPSPVRLVPPEAGSENTHRPEDLRQKWASAPPLRTPLKDRREVRELSLGLFVILNSKTSLSQAPVPLTGLKLWPVL